MPVRAVRRPARCRDCIRGAYGGQGKAAVVDPLAALLCELPTEQKRNSVLSVTGTGAGLAYFLGADGLLPG
jgi:hypothetical protein